MQDIAALGVRRVSVGGALARTAWGAFMRAARLMAEQGKFDGFANAASGDELDSFFRDDLAKRGPRIDDRSRTGPPPRSADWSSVEGSLHQGRRRRSLRRRRASTATISSSEIAISIVAAAVIVRLMLSLMPANICRGSVR